MVVLVVGCMVLIVRPFYGAGLVCLFGLLCFRFGWLSCLCLVVNSVGSWVLCCVVRLFGVLVCCVYIWLGYAVGLLIIVCWLLLVARLLFCWLRLLFVGCSFCCGTCLLVFGGLYWQLL